MRLLAGLKDPDIPQSFYILMAGRFVNLVGNSLVFPFMTIYLARRLDASMTVVGLVMTLYGLSQVAAQLIGGSLADSWGRRPVMLLALGAGAVCTLAVGLAPNPFLLIGFLVLMGLSVPLFQPASMAIVGDMVPAFKLSQSYSLMRMASNAGIIVGPMIGGFLADRSFLLVFGFDALSMAIFFVIVLVGIQEPPRQSTAVPGSAPGRMVDVVRSARAGPADRTAREAERDQEIPGGEDDDPEADGGDGAKRHRPESDGDHQHHRHDQRRGDDCYEHLHGAPRFLQGPVVGRV